MSSEWHIFSFLFLHSSIIWSSEQLLVKMESQAIFCSTWLKDFNLREKYYPYHPYFTEVKEKQVSFPVSPSN